MECQVTYVIRLRIGKVEQGGSVRHFGYMRLSAWPLMIARLEMVVWPARTLVYVPYKPASQLWECIAWFSVPDDGVEAIASDFGAE